MYNEAEPYQLSSLIAQGPFHRAHQQLFPALSFSKENVLFPGEKKQHEQYKQHDIILAALALHILFPSSKSRNPGFIWCKQRNYYVNKTTPG
jgi:hypothetical protein